MELKAGALFGGRYRLLRPLGEGAMGVVWAARNEAIDRDVAIKTIHANAAHHSDSIPRFLNEARICGSIRHPGIVDVLDLGQADDGSPFLVMEMLDGETLDDLMERQGIEPTHLLRVVRDVARTIALAHARGVVHRDLKPANIFLHRGATGEVTKVLDFGISKVLGAASATATSTGAIMGSPAYMSPEQAGGRGVIDGRADVFALGVILFEGLTGDLPFNAPNSNAMMVDIATKDVPSLRTILPSLAPEVADVVAACTRRHLPDRLASADALADALDRILGFPTRPLPTEPRVRAKPPEPTRTAVDATRALSHQVATISGATLGGRRPTSTTTRLLVFAPLALFLAAVAGIAWFTLRDPRAPAAAPSSSASVGVADETEATPSASASADDPQVAASASTAPVSASASATAVAASASVSAPRGKRPTLGKPAPTASGKRSDAVWGQFR